MTNEEHDSIVITTDDEGERLDKILAKHFETVKSRTYFQSLIEDEKVLLNGQAVKKRYRPKAGDEVEVYFSCDPAITLTPEAIPLDIVYEDEALLVINKPSGMVVHPAAGNWSGTFVNALLHHCGYSDLLAEDKDSLRPGIVHRLDKETTGLLVAAKQSNAQRLLIAQFSQRQVHKEYLALCVGNPGNRTIEQPIGRHPTLRKLMAVTPNGRNSTTICQTLAYNNELSYVKVTLITGRTHQIRVHLSHCGTPVLGDPLYGHERCNRKHGLQRQMLHAHRLRFNHPITGKLLELEAPLPNEMQSILKSEKLCVC